MIHGLRVRVRAINVIPLPQQINKIPAVAAAGIQYSHPGRDATFQKLIEKIDIDLTELFLQRQFSLCDIAQC
jgi:hypothetical protein